MIRGIKLPSLSIRNVKDTMFPCPENPRYGSALENNGCLKLNKTKNNFKTLKYGLGSCDSNSDVVITIGQACTCGDPEGGRGGGI